MMTEYYPSLGEILTILGEDGILVGSAAFKNSTDCKDYDFVINAAGFEKLARFEYYLYREDKTWWQYIPCDSNGDKAVDFFYGICDILDETKHLNRITFEQASTMPLKVVSIDGMDVLSI
ncbi:hypothetical protein PHABIO_165 [Pseudomonas phage Phabio]|uniref:Uncharacterized protein n=1 Tax=Pseudomonas phage Phabio TaxID=2006668 RepID=A0A1Y0SYR3_9CAUD|nr:hypothetical protein MZD05_gp165 [Pseudomonas phage Phabio]ARV76796.1 hypothetical protein PHABIO_165 [Pseudomonas phage Phabio]